MREEKGLVKNFLNRKNRERLKRPTAKINWDPVSKMRCSIYQRTEPHTVCQEQRSEHLEMLDRKTATFMLGGDTAQSLRFLRGKNRGADGN